MSNQAEMSFVDHLEQFRWHLIRAVLAVLVFTLAAFAAKEFLFHDIILAPSRTDFAMYKLLCWISDVTCVSELPFAIQSRTMTGQFMMHITASFTAGIVCAFPYVFWEMWSFIRPALYQDEQSAARGATFFVSLLFAMGVNFGYFVITPLSINFLSHYQIDPSIINEFDIASYVTLVTMLTLSCGMMFQLPMVVYFFSKAGLLTPELMRKFRKHAIIGILVLSAVLTPPDIISQFLISLPLFFLYEASITMSSIVAKKRQKVLEASLGN